jgi:hypothetical protein
VCHVDVFGEVDQEFLTSAGGECAGLGFDGAAARVRSRQDVT